MDLKKVVNVDDDWVIGGSDWQFLKSYSENEDKNCNWGIWVFIV